MSLGRRPLFVRQAEGSLQEQLEPELVVLRGDQSSIHQVIQPDQEAAGVGTQGSAKDGTGEPTDKCAKDKWPDARAGSPLGGQGLRITGRTGIGCLING
jgi:hypothetical protein